MGIWAAKCHCPATQAIVKPTGHAPQSRRATGLLNHGAGEEIFEGSARVAQLLKMIPGHAHGDTLRGVADQTPENAQLEKRGFPQNRGPADREFHVGSVWHAIRGMKQNASAADISRLAGARSNDLVAIDDSEFQIQLEGVAPLYATVAPDCVSRHLGLLEILIIRQKRTLDVVMRVLTGYVPGG